MAISKAYQVVTDRIISLIEETGEVPWSRPWRKAGKMIVGENYVSRKRYRGINAFTTAIFTEAAGFDSAQWMSFNQIKEAGGSLKKGSKGIPIVFFKLLDQADVSDGPQAVGSESRSTKIPFARYSTVFNLSQTEGIDYEPLTLTNEPSYNHDPIEAIEAKICSFRDLPKIVHENDSRAFYSPSLDTINVPPLSEFRDPYSFYSTLHHELIHASGHVGRLNRPTLGHEFGSKDYSKEELTAELGACFLDSEAGIFDHTKEQSAAYINGWLKVLKANPSWIVQAANAAQRAVEFYKGEGSAE